MIEEVEDACSVFHLAIDFMVVGCLPRKDRPAFYGRSWKRVRVYFSFSRLPPLLPIALLCLSLSQGDRLLSMIEVCSCQSSARLAEVDFSGGLS